MQRVFWRCSSPTTALMMLVLFALAPGVLCRADETPQIDSQVNEKRQAVYDLQQQLIPLLRRGEKDADAQEKARGLELKIAKLTEEMAQQTTQKAGQDNFTAATRILEGTLKTSPLGAPTPENPANPGPQATVDRQTGLIQGELAQAKQELAKREHQLVEYAQQMAKLERDRSLPPLPNAEVKVIALAKAPADETARTIESLFGPQTIRVATDDRTNSLIVLGDAASLNSVEALLARIDQQSNNKANTPGGTATSGTKATQSLLLRIFWLADGLPEGEGQDPAPYVPQPVLKAVQRLGLNGPLLVSQTVNSLAVGNDGPVEYSTVVPAIVFKQPTNLSCAGHMRPVIDDRAGLDVQISVMGQGINCQLSGSLATPLGHYMVLGTANSVTADPATVAAAGPMMGGPGMGMGMGPGGMPGMAAGRGAGFAGRGGAIPAAFGGPEGGAADPAAAPAAEPKYNSSRFAFVVQVIEAESFPPAE
jgi:hypothetical protein